MSEKLRRLMLWMFTIDHWIPQSAEQIQLEMIHSSKLSGEALSLKYTS